jgi:hypothetical protein
LDGDLIGCGSRLQAEKPRITNGVSAAIKVQGLSTETRTPESQAFLEGVLDGKRRRTERGLEAVTLEQSYATDPMKLPHAAMRMTKRSLGPESRLVGRKDSRKVML